MSNGLDGRLPGEHERLGHVEKYGEKEIVVGRLYSHSGSIGEPVFCVESASQNLIVIEYQNKVEERKEGKKNIAQFVDRFEPVSVGVVKGRGEKLRKEGEWLILKAEDMESFI